MASENLGLAHTVASDSRLDRDTSGATSTIAPGPSQGPDLGFPASSASLHGQVPSHSQGQGESQASALASASASGTANDSSLDPTIRALLGQQAEIEAKIAALLPRRHGPDLKVELAMLRHKFRSLRAFADDNREQPLRNLPTPNLY
jgi:hypothetical protein